MLVGHTHYNIDALFERWSMSLKKKNFPALMLFMKSSMDVELVYTIHHLIEVLNFKGFIVWCIVEEDEAFEGHTKAQQFKFFVDSTSCPTTKYRTHCSDNDWLPKEGGGIKLW
jgi:hypothetical protein